MVALDQNLKRPNADIKETAPARREKRAPVQQMKFGDETDLLNDSIPIIEKLYCWVTGKGFSIRDSQDIDQKNAEALWNGCKFDVPR